MQPLVLFLQYVVIGMALFLVLRFLRVQIPLAFRVFLFAAPGVTILSFLVLLWSSSKGTTPESVTLTMTVLKNAERILLGYCLEAVLVGPPAMNNLIRGLSIQVGITFLIATYGKLTNLHYMQDFFRSSGYSMFFLYFIMTMECGFGLLLLFNLRFYLKVSALVMLFAIMVGAVVTHARRGDPLSDSGNAIVLGVTILILGAIYLISRRSARSGPVYQ